MNRDTWGYLLLPLLVGMSACYSTSSGSGGFGGSAGLGGAGGGGGSAGGGSGGEGGTRACSSSGSVTVEYAGFGAEPDCIVPGVCITRGRVKGLYNSASELAANSTVSPEGTSWARSTCATASAPDDFTNLGALFPSGGGTGNGFGDNVVGEDLCLWLTNENLFYDMVFSEWGTVEASSFAYQRTAVGADECGVAEASCGASCDCPSGWENQGGDGVCVLPDPCASNPCGAGASCRKTGATSHRCECNPMEFTKPAGQTEVIDCVSDGVCLARGDDRGLYNSLEEDMSASSGVCDLEVAMRPSVPSLTEWVRMPCASAAPEDFVKFYDDAFACTGVPRRVVGFHSCLRTTHDGELWDIQFTDWCPSALTVDPSGCFSYVRWHAVEDGEACP
jgi:hypothetical protein